jgi:CRP/FNR family transcriptional regulator, nitrogen oxide reductase regulator
MMRAPAITAHQLELVSNSPFFRGLTAEELQAVLQTAQRRRQARGSYFFHQGEPATTFYILLEGRVRLTQLSPEGHQLILHLATPGEGIGIIVALSNVPYPVAAEVVEDATALAWDAESTNRLMEQYSCLALNGLRLVARRFGELQNRYRELATERVERRVARALLRLARQMGKRVEGGVLIDMILSRQDLAEMTGTTLYTVSRILSGWEQQGLVESGRERVTIRSPHGLVAIAEDLPPTGPERKQGAA